MLDTLLNLIEDRPMTEITMMLRTGPRGLVRHGIRDGAAESMCGIDRSILFSEAEIANISRAEHCPVCTSAIQVATGKGVYLRRIPGRAA